MSEALHEHPNQNVVDALELAFRDIDFEPMSHSFIEGINEPNPTEKIVSGSIRLMNGYDFEAQSVVHVLESYAVVATNSSVDTDGDHRLTVWWEGGRSRPDEFSLDDMEVIFSEGEEVTDKKIASTKHRLMQALKVVMTND